MTTETDLITLLEEGFASTYEAEAEGLQHEVLGLLSSGGSSHFPLLEHAFGKAMRQIRSFRIAPLDKGAFAFDSITGRFTISERPLSALLRRVLDDVRGADEDGQFILDRDEVHPLLRGAFRLYLLHEVGHLAQGLADHASVGALKKIAGEEFMADMDLFADRNAAAAYAVLEVAGRNVGRAAYLENFKHALFFSGQYSFPVFRFTADRPPKMTRAIGLTLMAARLARVDLESADLAEVECASPLDGCIMVKVSRDYSSVVVVLSEPDTQIVNITCEVPDGRMKALATKISEGDFLGALKIASAFLSSLVL